MSQSIILFSHGSVLCGAGESLLAIAHGLEMLADCKVGVGYLNYSEPSFVDAVDLAIADGASEIVVVPYFLVAGYFVQQKLPPLIDAAQARHPHVMFRVADAMRANPLMRDIVLASAQQTRTIDEWRLWWKVAPEFCQNDTACPLYDSAFCPKGNSNTEKLESNLDGIVENGRDEDIMRVNFPSVIYQEVLSIDPSFPLTQQSNFSANTALLVLVHGSPREESNVDMYAVVDEVRAAQKYFYVQVGFLECNDPAIPKAIEKCIQAGAKRIVTVPYFLHAGRHVADDLPQFLEEASKQYPRIEFLMGDYLGREPLLAKVLLQLAQNSKPSSAYE